MGVLNSMNVSPRWLDRVLCNVAWRLKFHEGFAKVIPRVQSDHHPLVILSEGVPYSGGVCPFRFEFVWVTHAHFSRLVAKNWNVNPDMIHKLSTSLLN
jgi:hypothetical protein